MIKVPDEQVIKAFLFTVEEFKRFSDFFAVKKQKTLLDDYTEKEYVAIQTKLVLLRKYSFIRESVYIPNVIKAAKNMYPELKENLSEIEKRYNDIEKNQLQAVLADGNKLALFELQENVVYGIYLHADIDKIENLLKTNEALYFAMTRRFVDEVEEIVFQIYELLDIRISDKFERMQLEKASVIFAGKTENSKQEITGSPFWGNIYGRDATDEDIEKIAKASSLEDIEILLKSLAFVKELEKDDYSIEKLDALVFPPTRDDWGDFSGVRKALKHETEHIGWSTRVRYNERHDMAYVNLYPNVKEAFILDQPHIVTGISTITLVKENNEYGWRIFAIGDKVKDYKKESTLGKWFKSAFKKKKRQ